MQGDEGHCKFAGFFNTASSTSSFDDQVIFTNMFKARNQTWPFRLDFSWWMWVCLKIGPNSDLDAGKMMIPTIGFASPQFGDKPMWWAHDAKLSVVLWLQIVDADELINDLSVAGTSKSLKTLLPYRSRWTFCVTATEMWKETDRSALKPHEGSRSITKPWPILERLPCLKIWFQKGTYMLFSQKIGKNHSSAGGSPYFCESILYKKMSRQSKPLRIEKAHRASATRSPAYHPQMHP